MFVILNAKRLWIFFIAIVVICIICFLSVTIACYIPKNSFMVVIDAGHGGIDGGVSGVESGVKESEINLLVAFSLKEALERHNVKVVLTREEDSLLGEEKSKQSDFKKRKEIINDTMPDAVISIHQNKFPDNNRRGAQVFFNVNSHSGKELASSVQYSLNSLNKENIGREFTALKGDYYILNCSDYPSCIVECGFLSNPADESLLLEADYRERIAKRITSGVIAYLNERTL